MEPVAPKVEGQCDFCKTKCNPDVYAHLDIGKDPVVFWLCKECMARAKRDARFLFADDGV